MAIPSNKPQNRILLFGGIIFALLAGVVVYLAVSKGAGSPSSSQNATPTTPVVVASSPIQAGTQISASEVSLTAFPTADLPSTYFTSTSGVLGKTASEDIVKGSVITQAMALSPGSAGGSVSTGPGGLFTISEGYVALAVPAHGSTADTSVDQMTVGYFIQPGDQIDIIADLGGPTSNSHAIGYVFQDVPVLDVGYAQTSNPNPSPSASAAPTVTLQAPAYFVVEMPRNQATMMTAILTGTFSVPPSAAPSPSTSSSSSSSATTPTSNPPVVLKYVLRPTTEYGTFTTSGGKTTFAPDIIPPSSYVVNPPADSLVTPQSLSQALGG
ncbi:MAG TPA: Flp pilus assembly protein CpaB [Candidatus Binatia bacterium]|nr:Flp pilus assembly protein CpaB [Candidatus Binatia bacterium]